MEFRILGPLEVVDGDEHVRLGTAKQQALLAVLLLHANEVVSRERLIDELWGERPPATADKAVQVYVSQLRKALARNGNAIATRAHGYVLEVAPECLDVACFQQLVADARERLRAGETEAAARLYRQALALWRGRPLAGLDFESRSQAEVEGLEELRLSAFMDLLDCELALGRHEQAIGELERLVAGHPLQERLRGQLILALYRSGRQADALREYRETRQTLVEQLGIEPSASLQRLERAILTHDPALEAPTGIARADARPSSTPPTGTVTFLFTDIERSTALVRRLGDEYPTLLAEHHRLLHEAFGPRGGHDVDRQGDALFVAFRRAKDAVAAAVDAQRAISAAGWPQGVDVRIRIGIHTGEPGLADTGYHGLDVVRAARIAAACHGGQVLVSGTTRGLLGDHPLPGVALTELGEHRLKGFEHPEPLFQVAAEGLADDFPPLRDVDPTIVVAGREDELAAAAEAAVATRETRRPALARSGIVMAAVVALVVVVLAMRAQDGGSVVGKPNSLLAIDIASERPVRILPVGARPSGVARGGRLLWVPNVGDGTVSSVDATSGRTRVFSLGTPEGAHPSAVAVGAAAVWVALGVERELRRLDLRFGGRAVDPPVPLSRQPVAVALHGGRVCAALEAAVECFDADGGGRLTITPESGATALAFANDALWVGGFGAITRLDPGEREVRDAIRVPGRGRALVADRRALFAAFETWFTETSNGIARVPSGARAPDRILALDGRPSGIALADGDLWVAIGEHEELLRIDLREWKIVRRIGLGATPTGVVSGLGRLWVTVE